MGWWRPPPARSMATSSGSRDPVVYVLLPGALTPTRVADLIEFSDLGFVPITIGTDQFGKSGGLKYSAKSLDRLRRLRQVTSLSVVGDGGSLRLTGMGGWPAQVLVLETSSWPSEGLIEATSVLSGFVAAMVGDAEDVFWRSADQINTYYVHARPSQHLPKVWDEVFDRDKIDISHNPGRQVPAPGMWLWAAPKIWFGPGSMSLIDRDRLLSVPVGQVLTRGVRVVVVELFDLSDELGAIREAQQTLGDWLDFDGLEQQGAKLAGALMDPRIEFEEGSLPNGGVRRVIEWIDDGRAVPELAATERRRLELDEAGHVVWQETTAVD